MKYVLMVIFLAKCTPKCIVSNNNDKKMVLVVVRKSLRKLAHAIYRDF